MGNHIDPLRQLRPIREDELGGLATEHRASPMAGPLAYDVYKVGSDLVIEFDIPGAGPTDVDVTLEDRTLAVRIRRDLANGSGVDVIEAGRQHGEFTQRLFLGDRWNLDALDAEVRDGVLRVRAPLVRQPARRRVQVTAAPSQQASWVAPRTVADALEPAIWDGSSEARHGSEGVAAHSAA